VNQYTLENLQDKLDRNILYRKRELTILKTQIAESTGNVLNTFIRAGIVFLYAHWEGFIKEGAKEFLKFLNHQNVPRKELKDNYFIASLKYKIIDCGQSKSTRKHSELIAEVMYNDSLTFNVNLNKAEEPIINSESNLKSSVFDEILYILGLDKEPFELKYTLLDEKLLNHRNKIAHGVNVSFLRSESRELEENAKRDYEELYHAILELMDLFKDKILETAKNKLYLKVNS